MQTPIVSLNLLPLEDKKRLGYERMSRFFKLSLSITAGFFFIGDILLLPSFFFLYFEHKGLVQQEAVLERNTQTEHAKTVEARVKEINAKLKRFPKEHALTPSSVTRFVADISDSMRAGIILKSFTYQKEEGSISIRGSAARRDNLLAFISRLRENPAFKNVESPVANLLLEELIEFDIHISLIEKTEKDEKK